MATLTAAPILKVDISPLPVDYSAYTSRAEMLRKSRSINEYSLPVDSISSPGYISTSSSSSSSTSSSSPCESNIDSSVMNCDSYPSEYSQHFHRENVRQIDNALLALDQDQYKVLSRLLLKHFSGSRGRRDSNHSDTSSPVPDDYCEEDPHTWPSNWLAQAPAMILEPDVYLASKPTLNSYQRALIRRISCKYESLVEHYLHQLLAIRESGTMNRDKSSTIKDSFEAFWTSHQQKSLSNSTPLYRSPSIPYDQTISEYCLPHRKKYSITSPQSIPFSSLSYSSTVSSSSQPLCVKSLSCEESLTKAHESLSLLRMPVSPNFQLQQQQQQQQQTKIDNGIFSIQTDSSHIYTTNNVYSTSTITTTSNANNILTRPLGYQQYDMDKSQKSNYVTNCSTSDINNQRILEQSNYKGESSNRSGSRLTRLPSLQLNKWSSKMKVYLRKNN